MRLLTGVNVDAMVPAALVSNYLMSSYAYEFLHETYMEDSAYDHLCKRLDTLWDSIEHQHKHLIQRSALSATTGFYLKQKDFPMIVRLTAGYLVLAAKRGELIPTKQGAGPPFGFTYHAQGTPQGT